MARRVLSLLVLVLVLVPFPFSLCPFSFFLFFFLENRAFHKLATGEAREEGGKGDDRWKLVPDGFGNRAGTVELEFFEASLD